MGLEPTNLLTASQALYQLSYAPGGNRSRYQAPQRPHPGTGQPPLSPKISRRRYDRCLRQFDVEVDPEEFQVAASQTSSSGARHHLTAGVVGAAALGVALCACSSSVPGTSGAPHGTPHQVVLASVDSTESADSAAIGLSISVTGTPSLGGLGALGGSTGSSAAAPVNFRLTGHGVFSFADKTGDMTIEVPATGTTPGGSLEIRRIGQDLYLGGPQIAAADGGKPWVHVSVSQYQQFEQGQSQSSAGPLGSLADGDPTKALALLQQLGAQVTEVGTSQIDGVATTEYQGQLDLAGGTTGSTIVNRQLAQALGLSNVPVDVWIDGQGRARQVSTSLSLFGLSISVEETMGSFGTPVSVTAPPADQVADGSGLLQNGKMANLFGGSGSAAG